MLNKFITYGGTLGFVLILLFGHDVVSYLMTASTLASSAVRSKIPINFEIDRATRMIEELTPTIRENMVVIAREEIEIEQLREQIAELQNAQTSRRTNLEEMQQDLTSGREQFTRGKTRFTATEFASVAESTFDRYRTQNQTLQSLQQNVAVRQQALDAAHKQLASLVSAKEQLAAEIESLKARQAMNEVAKSSQELRGQTLLDDSQLTRTRKLVREIETRIRIDERLSAAELHFMDEVTPVVDTSLETQTTDIAEKIENYLASESVGEVIPAGSLAVPDRSQPAILETVAN